MSISRETLESVGIRGCAFIETGSRWGDTTMRALELGAACACTIESDWRLHSVAKERLIEKFDNVCVWRGDSAKILPEVLDALPIAPVVFWLDAHSDTHSPVLEELAAIRVWGRPCTILIDDMRVFRAGHWGVSEDEILAALQDAIVSFLPGIESHDILMARVR